MRSKPIHTDARTVDEASTLRTRLHEHYFSVNRLFSHYTANLLIKFRRFLGLTIMLIFRRQSDKRVADLRRSPHARFSLKGASPFLRSSWDEPKTVKPPFRPEAAASYCYIDGHSLWPSPHSFESTAGNVQAAFFAIWDSQAPHTIEDIKHIRHKNILTGSQIASTMGAPSLFWTMWPEYGHLGQWIAEGFAGDTSCRLATVAVIQA